MQLGVFRSSGGISIINAIGSGGYGGAAGIDLWLEVRAREEPGIYSGRSHWPGGSGSLPENLVKAIADAATRLTGHEFEGLWLDVSSEIPPGRGLKSSAALLTAALGATVNLAQHSLGSEEIAAAASRLSIHLGLSATGALDDHAASIIDAPIVTWNPGFKLKRVLPRSGCDLSVVIGYNEVVNPIGTLDVKPFRALRRLYTAAAELALEGNWIEATAVNGLASAAVFGLERLALKMLSLGALSAGITGKGPAFFALAKNDLVDNIISILDSQGFTDILLSRFRWCG